MKTKTLLALVAASNLLWVGVARAQTLFLDTLKQLQSRDWIMRANALDQLQSHPEWLTTSEAKSALLDLLDHENRGDAKRGSGFGVTGDEEHAEYYARIGDLVYSFVDSSDPRAVEIVTHSVFAANSRFGAKLASFGEIVVAPLLALSRHEDVGRDISQRANAYTMLGFVLHAHRQKMSVHPLSEQSERLMETRLHEGLHDRLAAIRLSAIYGVVAAEDIDALPVLEQLARADSHVTRMDDGRTRYLVREEATRAIASLKVKVESR